MPQAFVANGQLPDVRRGRWRLLWWVGVVVVWCSVVGGGVFKLARYEREPGRQALAPPQWPLASRLERGAARPTLVVAVHPHCPCTAASLAALEQIVRDVPGAARVFVVFLQWDEVAEDRVATSLRDQAGRIAGIQVVEDLDGTIARGFGALTSGQTYLYDEAGSLVFQGGLTQARGQAGESSGRLAIVSYLISRDPKVRETPTYGCPLFSDAVD